MEIDLTVVRFFRSRVSFCLLVGLCDMVKYDVHMHISLYVLLHAWVLTYTHTHRERERERASNKSA